MSMESIVAQIRQKQPFEPDLGIICGSGLGGLANTLSDPTVIKYEDIQGFPRTTVAGHAGELVFGVLNGTKVVCMKGRFHYYEGNSPAKVATPVRVMGALGIRVLIVTNAAGGVNSKFRVGDLMMIKDHISMMGLSGLHPLTGPNDSRFGPRFPPVGSVYDKKLRELFKKAAAATRYSGTLQEGVYFGVSGPSYETPHEIQMMRILGGDSVGMSTVQEVLQAAHMNIPVLGLSLITNRCLGPDDDWELPSHQEVLDAVKVSQTAIQTAVTEFVGRLDISTYPRLETYEKFLDAKSSSSGSSSVSLSTVGKLVVMAGGFILLSKFLNRK